MESKVVRIPNEVTRQSTSITLEKKTAVCTVPIVSMLAATRGPISIRTKSRSLGTKSANDQGRPLVSSISMTRGSSAYSVLVPSYLWLSSQEIVAAAASTGRRIWTFPCLDAYLPMGVAHGGFCVKMAPAMQEELEMTRREGFANTSSIAG